MKRSYGLLDPLWCERRRSGNGLPLELVQRARKDHRLTPVIIHDGDAVVPLGGQKLLLGLVDPGVFRGAVAA